MIRSFDFLIPLLRSPSVRYYTCRVTLCKISSNILDLTFNHRTFYISLVFHKVNVFGMHICVRYENFKSQVGLKPFLKM